MTISSTIVLVQIVDLLAGQLFQLCDGADADHVVLVLDVDPHRNARSPEAVAADVPVLGIGQPVGKALFADIVRHPVHARVVLEHTLAQSSTRTYHASMAR